MITDADNHKVYNESQAYKNYMHEIEDMVLVKDRHNSVADNYRGARPEDFRTGEQSVSS